MKPRVALIVLTFNNLSDTSVALESIAALSYPNREIVLVDNGSTDGSTAALRGRFPKITIIENGANLGFAAGNNVGLKYAAERGADYMMLLNNDIKAAPDMLDIMMAAAESDPRIGMLGPAVHDFGDRPNNVGWRFNRRWGYSVRIRNEEADGGIIDVDTISGCALMARREVYEKIGGLDESFFLLVEDVDWCLRCAAAGYRVVTAARAKLWHLNCATLARKSPERLYYEYRNHLMALRRHCGVFAWPAAFPCWLLRRRRERGEIRRDPSLTPEARSERLRALRQAVADFLAGRVGRGPDWLSPAR